MLLKLLKALVNVLSPNAYGKEGDKDREPESWGGWHLAHGPYWGIGLVLRVL